jgi:hypothetical protein
MPLSTVFQLYRGDQFNWWRKSEYPENLSYKATPSEMKVFSYEGWSIMRGQISSILLSKCNDLSVHDIRPDKKGINV